MTENYFSYREAARATRRSVMTIKRWRRHGLPMGWETREGQRVRVVREDVLKAWWRERMTHDPVWQNKMRRRRQDELREVNELLAAAAGGHQSHPGWTLDSTRSAQITRQRQTFD